MIEEDTQMNRYMEEQLGSCTVVAKKGLNAMYKDKKGDHYIVSINKTHRLVNELVPLSSRIASYGFSIEEIYDIVEKLNSSVIKIICKNRLFPKYITSCDKYYLYKCKRMTSDWVGCRQFIGGYSLVENPWLYLFGLDRDSQGHGSLG